MSAITPGDVFERLAAADPARSHAPFNPTSLRGQALFERSLTPPPRRFWTRKRVAAVVVATAVAAAAAFAWTHRKHPTRVQSIACYQTASLKSSLYVVTPDPDPIASCRDLWVNGPIARTGRPPPLVACIIPTGVLGVFPGGPSTCARLHLSTAASLVPADRKVAALRDRLVAAFGTSGCLAPDEGRAVAAQALSELRFRGWRIAASGPFGADRPCVSYSLDEVNKTVFLVPYPRR
jgi:hypothetical protein